MNVVGHIKVDMAPVSAVMQQLGVTARGDVQRFHTATDIILSQVYATSDRVSFEWKI